MGIKEYLMARRHTVSKHFSFLKKKIRMVLLNILKNENSYEDLEYHIKSLFLIFIAVHPHFPILLCPRFFEFPV